MKSRQSAFEIKVLSGTVVMWDSATDEGMIAYRDKYLLFHRHQLCRVLLEPQIGDKCEFQLRSGAAEATDTSLQVVRLLDRPLCPAEVEQWSALINRADDVSLWIEQMT